MRNRISARELFDQLHERLALRWLTAGQRGGVLRGLLAGGVMFLRMYVLRLGFLCGGAGFLYSLFIGLEAFFRYAVLFYDRDTLTDRAGR